MLKTYCLQPISEELTLTGKGEDLQWKKADLLSDFGYPWDGKNDIKSVSFKAVHSKKWVYALFEVHVDNVKTYVSNNNKTEVINSDRVEMFFRRDDRLAPYYCLEIDAMGRVFDYEAEYHRKFNTQWSWPAQQLLVHTHQTKNDYTVEIALSKDSLTSLGLLQGTRIQAGLFRGECEELKGDIASMKWISWLAPDSPTPDFHIPSSFGELILED